MKRAIFMIVVTVAGLAAGSGCDSKLETGYQPKRLDMPLSQRQTLYADPYSEEAMRAQQEQQQSGGGGGQFRKPGQP